MFKRENMLGKLKTFQRIGTLAILFLGFSFTAVGQTKISAYTKNALDQMPIPFATIGVKNKNSGCIADSTGKFILLMPPEIQDTDTIIISSIGYHKNTVSVGDAKSRDEFFLIRFVKELQHVTVSNQIKFIEIGSLPKGNPSFSMGWGNDGQGGEAGNVFSLSFTNFYITKVAVKISTTYDTCWFRLHIRDLKNGIPDEELLLTELISITTQKDDSVEFDLTGADNYFINKEIFIGFELLKHSLNGSKSKSEGNYMVYGGTEPGQFKSFHKWFSNSTWQKGRGHSFSIKLYINQ